MHIIDSLNLMNRNQAAYWIAYLFMPVLYYYFFTGVTKAIEWFFEFTIIKGKQKKIPFIYWVVSMLLCWCFAWYISGELNNANFNLMHMLKVFLLFAIPILHGMYECNKTVQKMTKKELDEFILQVENESLQDE